MLTELLKLLFFIIYKFIPKKKGLLVFGDRAGQRFADNSRHLFLYINNKLKNKFRPIWITKNKGIYNFLNSKNYEVYYSKSFKGIFYCLIAEWHLFNFVEDDINSFITRFSNCILLWHGVLPKRVKVIKFNKSKINNFIYKRTKKFFVYPDRKLADNLLNYFPEHKYNLLISNLPRNLILSNNDNVFFNKNENKLIKILKDKKKKVYGYFPTWRSDGLEVFRDIENFSELEKIDNALSSNNSLILLKIHMNSDKKDGDRRYNPKIENIIEKLKNLKSFIFVDYEVDLNSILKHCDFLITDYSGVVFDYLYLKKPIILYAPDYEEFKKENGFVIDVIEKKIALIANNISELGDIINKYSQNLQESKEYKKNKETLLNEIFKDENKEIENIIEKLKN